MYWTEWVVVVSQTVILVFGGLLTVLSRRTYRRTGAAAFRALAAGFGLLTAGAAIGGGLHQATGVGLAASMSVQSAFTAAALAAITYSLYTTRLASDRVPGK